MRKFSINCDFGGQLAPFDIFIGQPEQGHHPLHFQADWLLKQRGGTILPEVMDAISKLNTLAQENGVPLEDLCVYALGSAQDGTSPTATATESDATGVAGTEPYTDGMTVEEVPAAGTTGEIQTPETTELPEEALSSNAEEIKDSSLLETVENDESQTTQEEMNNEQQDIENKE